jgi:2-polyprenyl-6-methoxyphenol hydroxylase-like FAD-dependent oxidoreductase
MSALALSQAGCKVLLLEKNADLLSGTSNMTPGRMGLGFHYTHAETGLLYLESTLQFTRQWLAECPALRIGEHAPTSHYLRRGRYFLVRGAHCDKERLLQSYATYQQRYQQLVAHDPQNQVFGPPEHFYRVLAPHEYQDDVNMAKVELGVETCEQLLNWPHFRTYILRKIAQSDAIQIRTGQQVSAIRYDHAQLDYLLHIRHSNGSTSLIRAPYVVNASWECAESLTAQAHGSAQQPHQRFARTPASTSDVVRTNRLKALAHVVLPATLQQKPSMFFCMGPYGMFSNLGDGTGLISYAPVTNIACSTAVSPPADFIRLTQQDATPAEKAYYGQGILTGVAQFLPAMTQAHLHDVRFGVVKTRGHVDIDDPTSDVHQRNYTGVVEHGLGWIENSCMKLLFGYANGQRVVEIIRRQQRCRQTVEGLIDRVLAQQGSVGAARHTIKAQIRRALPFTAYTSDPDAVEALCHRAYDIATRTVTLCPDRGPHTGHDDSPAVAGRAAREQLYPSAHR